MSLHINPEYDKMLPRMSEEEFQELKKSIESEGQHYPIIVNQDLEVLDGHHRYRACVELGIDPDFEVKQFDDKLLEKKFVIEANLRRRHLNNFQLVELAVPLLAIEKALAKKRRTESGNDDEELRLGIKPEDAESEQPENKAKTTEAIAKRAGLSASTLERGKKVLEKADEEDLKKLREGKTSINKVYQEIVSEGKPAAPEPEPVHHDAETDRHNNEELLAILEKFVSEELYCPSCGNTMFECSKCHRTLKELLAKYKADKLEQNP